MVKVATAEIIDIPDPKLRALERHRLYSKRELEAAGLATGWHRTSRCS